MRVCSHSGTVRIRHCAKSRLGMFLVYASLYASFLEELPGCSAEKGTVRREWWVNVWAERYFVYILGY